MDTSPSTAPEPHRLFSRPSSVDLYVTTVVSLAVAVLASLAWLRPHDAFGPGRPTWFVVFALLLTAGEVRPIKWLRLDDGGEVTMSWAFAFCLILLGSITGALVAIAIASAIGDLTRRKPVRRVLFNAAQLSLSLGVASAILALAGHRTTLVLGGPLDAGWFATLTAAAVASFMLNGALTCTALALHEGTSVVAMLRRGLLPNLSTDGALLALAPCFLVIAQRSVLLLPLVLVTATFVYRSSRAALASEHAATHDVLTELLNRRAFTDRVDAWLEESVGRTPRGAVALIDLNGFKQINDRLGHQVGDQVLQEIGRRLTAERQAGQIVARLGGDEFALLLTTISTREEALAKGREIHAQLLRPFDNGGFPVALGGSVGIAMIPEHDELRETILHQADLAMYKAKRTGSGVELYAESSEARERGRMGLLSDLGGAIARDELLLHFQPQFDLTSGELFGVEALLRWEHPRLGMVGPGEFMPLAEHTELMGPITEYVLRRALSTYSAWQELGIDLRFAINASAQNLSDMRFPDSVAAILADTGVPARALEIEITENTVMADPERTRAVLFQLQAQGIRLALDDFGTGYSSLTNLRDLPIDAIKIDRSFVRDLATDAGDRRIVSSLIDLAHGLDLEVTAEGVEDADALDVLESFGCDSAQGYLLGKPMSAVDLLALVRRRASAIRLPEAS